MNEVLSQAAVGGLLRSRALSAEPSAWHTISKNEIQEGNLDKSPTDGSRTQKPPTGKYAEKERVGEEQEPFLMRMCFLLESTISRWGLPVSPGTPRYSRELGQCWVPHA